MKSRLFAVLALLSSFTFAADKELVSGHVEQASELLAGVDYRVTYDDATGKLRLRMMGSMLSSSSPIIYQAMGVLDDAGNAVNGYIGNCGHEPGPNDVLMDLADDGWYQFEINASDYSGNFGMFLVVVIRKDDAANYEAWFGVTNMTVPNDWANYDWSWDNRIKFSLKLPGVDRIIVSGSYPEVRDRTATLVGSSVVLEAMPTADQPAFPPGAPTWTVTSKPATSTFSLPPPAAGKTVTVTPDVKGDYTFTATCGASSAAFTLTAVAVGVTVRAAGSADATYGPAATIATGGKDSPVHRASVKFELDPVPSYAYALTATVTLSGAAGAADYPTPAVLSGAVSITGDASAQVTFTTSSVEATLTSSNVIRVCTISAPGDSAAVTFAWADVTTWVSQEEYLTVNSSSNETLTLKLSDLAIDQHKLKLYIEEVQYANDEGDLVVLENTIANPHPEVSAWAYFQPDEERTNTNGAGTAVLKIPDVPNLCSILMVAYDLSANKP